MVGCGSPQQSTPAVPAPAKDSSNSPATVTVELLSGAGTGSREFTVDWADGMTALDATIALRDQHAIELKFRGDGATAFVSAIAGIENQGAGGDNWVYLINGKLGTASCDVADLHAGDRLTWRFGDYQPEER